MHTDGVRGPMDLNLESPNNPAVMARQGNRRLVAAAPFACLAVLAIIAAGLVAAAIAYNPTEPMVWMVAYLVLVVGVMQAVFGVGQAWLAERVPARSTCWGQWSVFNLGNAGVIGGTLGNSALVVAIGTLLFAVAVAWFLVGVRRSRARGWGIAYRILLVLILVSACVGLAISITTRGLA